VHKRDAAFAILPAYTARPKARVAAAIGAPHWVRHDLRRTATADIDVAAASGGAELLPAA
jgi:hypothetical protein